MDFSAIIGSLQNALIPLITFVVLLIYTMVRGRRAMTSLILGLYFALLISLKFPYYAKIRESVGGALSETTISIAVFILFTALFSILMDRLLFYRVDETAFAGLWKKVLLALFATVLVMAYSYHVLPITQLIDPGSSAQYLFAPPQYFFWWLIAPLVGLFFV